MAYILSSLKDFIVNWHTVRQEKKMIWQVVVIVGHSKHSVAWDVCLAQRLLNSTNMYVLIYVLLSASSLVLVWQCCFECFVKPPVKYPGIHFDFWWQSILWNIGVRKKKKRVEVRWYCLKLIVLWEFRPMWYWKLERVSKKKNRMTRGF